MVEYLNRVVVEVQSCQVGCVLEQVTVQRVDLVVAQVQRLQGNLRVYSIYVAPLENLTPQHLAWKCTLLLLYH